MSQCGPKEYRLLCEVLAANLGASAGGSGPVMGRMPDAHAIRRTKDKAVIIPETVEAVS